MTVPRRIAFVTGGAGFIGSNIVAKLAEDRSLDVEVVIHMAAVSTTTEPDADKIIHSNFTLSRDLFRWCADRQRRFVYASSAATYGDGSAGFVDTNKATVVDVKLPRGEAKKLPIGKNVFLEIDGTKRRVLVATTVCLRMGQLEQLLTRKRKGDAFQGAHHLSLP